MAEGIIFGNYFLNYDQFEIVFKQWYEEKFILFKTSLLDLINQYQGGQKRISSAGKALKFYQDWEKIEEEYFGNGAIALSVIIKNEDDSYTFSNLLDEKSYINESGKLKLRRHYIVNELEKAEQREKLQEQLNNHFSYLNNYLNTHILDSEEASVLHKIIGARSQETRYKGRHFKGKTYSEILFSRNKSGKGQIFDAYMNHLGAKHMEVYKYLANAELDIPPHYQIDNDFEQIFSNFYSIQNWLLDATNNTAWYRSGDVLAVGQDGEVLYNVQVKSSQQLIGANWQIKFTTLYKAILSMYNSMSPEELGKLMYENFKTDSSNQVNFKKAEEFVESSAYKMIQKNLKLNTDIKLTFK